MHAARSLQSSAVVSHGAGPYSAVDCPVYERHEARQQPAQYARELARIVCAYYVHSLPVCHLKPSPGEAQAHKCTRKRSQ
eukprot:3739122-Rhodomonas_salina.3